MKVPLTFHGQTGTCNKGRFNPVTVAYIFHDRKYIGLLR